MHLAKLKPQIFCVTATGAVAFILALLYIKAWIASLTFPFALSFEGHILWASWKLACAQNIYSQASLLSLPAAVMIYPPFYMLIGALFLKLFGFSYCSLRLVTVLGTLCFVPLAFKLFCQSGCRALSATTAVLLFMSFTPVFIFSSLARCDLLALLMAVSGLYAFMRVYRQASGSKSFFHNYWLVMLLLVVSCMTRQQSIAAPIAIILFLLGVGQKRLAFSFLLWFFAALTVVILTIQFLTGGFLSHIFFLRQADWHWQLLVHNFFLLGHDAVKLSIGLTALIVSYIGKRNVETYERLPLSLLFVSALSVLYSMAWIGASSNHLLFVYFAFSWLVAINLERVPWCMPAVLASCLIGIIPVAQVLPDKVKELSVQQASDKLFPRRPGLVLSEDPYWAIKFNCQPDMVDPLTLMYAWHAKQKMTAELLESIRQEKYSALLLNSFDSIHGGGNVWTPAIMQAVYSHYRLVGRMAGNGEMQCLYLPADKLTASPPGLP